MHIQVQTILIDNNNVFLVLWSLGRLYKSHDPRNQYFRYIHRGIDIFPHNIIDHIYIFLLQSIAHAHCSLHGTFFLREFQRVNKGIARIGKGLAYVLKYQHQRMTKIYNCWTILELVEAALKYNLHMYNYQEV